MLLREQRHKDKSAQNETRLPPSNEFGGIFPDFAPVPRSIHADALEYNATNRDMINVTSKRVWRHLRK